MKIDLPTRIINYSSDNDDEPQLMLEVCQANYFQGIVRTLTIEKETQAISGRPDVSQAEIVIRMMIYPSLIAAVKSHEGFESWPVSYQEFAMLPENFVVEWEQATFDLNPNWRGTPPLPRKKARRSSKESSS